ncbi:putative transcription factor WRKY family [Helianthus annuus]|uniref:Putative WRKY domain-containing protein n=1 Tax=Helianthus annuus TaxID=4232 RepID=A0A251T976_HELAN|nr:putative transcription factor WRKY family [Helianthus annuus]
MRERVHTTTKFALRMKTNLEVVDDGYKWKKYGKKKIKSSPYPRNYFKCSTVGCNVKKRIERDMKDSSYVITTYDGVHKVAPDL